MSSQVVIKIAGDIKDYQKSISNVDKETKSLGTKLSSTGKSLSSAFVPVVASLAGVTAGVVAVTKAYAAQEQAQIRTVQTLESTGFAAGITSDEVFRLASSLQEVTTVGDETTIAASNILLTFKNIGEEVFPRVVESVLDVSQALGQSAQSSAIQLGKALNDPITGLTALTRVGITFTEEQKEQIRTLQRSGSVLDAQKVILEELESQFGGVARAAAGGTGVFKQVSNELGDIAEVIGERLFPFLEPVAKSFLSLAKNIKSFLSTSSSSNKTLEQLKEDVKTAGEEVEKLQAKFDEASKNPFKAKFQGIDINLLESELQKAKVAVIDSEIELNKRREEIAKASEGKKAKEVQAIQTQTQKDNLKKELEQIAQAEEAKLNARKEILIANKKILDEELGEGEVSEENIENEIELERIKQEELNLVREEARIKDLISKEKFQDAEDKIKELDVKTTLKNLKLKNKITELSEQERQSIITSSLSQISSLQSSNSKALVAIGKAAGIANVIISTNVGAAKALELGAIGFPLAAAIIAAGAVNVGNIAGITGFNQGGVLGGFSGATVGRDQRLFAGRDGEMILNAPQQRSLFDAINNGELGGGGQDIAVNVMIQGPTAQSLFKVVEKQTVRNRANGTSRI